MAEKQDDGPSLELPSLFGRRKKRSPRSDASDASGTTSDAATDVIDPAPADRDRTTVITPPGEAEKPSGRQAAEQTAVIPPVKEPVKEPIKEAVKNPLQETPPPPAEAPPTAAPPRPTARSEPPPTAAAAPPSPASAPPPAAPANEPVAATAAGPSEPKASARERFESSLPTLAAGTAAVVVGAVVGVVGCLMTLGGLKSCEVATGTDSCGGPGLLVLVVIVVAMGLLGAALLNSFGVPDAGNLSFLGTGVMVVVTLVFLLDYLYNPWMFLAIPVITALGFALARWVTTRYVDDGSTDLPEQHDIR